MAIIQGKDGACSLPSGNAALINTWSATFSHVVNDFTSFGNTGMVRQLGLPDIQGSAGGFMETGSSKDISLFGSEESSKTGQHTIGAAGAEMTLTIATGCTIVFSAIIDTISINSAVAGDASITFNFQMSDANGATVAWDD